MASKKNHYLVFIQKKWLKSDDRRIAYWMKESNFDKGMAGGTLWLVTSWKRKGKPRVYSLVAKLTDCKKTMDGDPKEVEWPVRLQGSTTSRQYATNFANYVLMGLRFATKNPIKHKDEIGWTLQNPRKLSSGDVDLLKEYQKMLTDRPAVFLSHSHKDNRVGQIERDLEAAGIGVFRDFNAITLGDEWQETINRAIKNSAVFVYLHTDEAAASNYVADEIREVLRVRKQSKTPVIVAVATQASDLPKAEPFDGLNLDNIQALEWAHAGARQKVVKDIHRILAEHYVP